MLLRINGWDELWGAGAAGESLPARPCRGTLVSREQYLVDIGEWGYLDSETAGRMTPQDRARGWTSAILAADK